MTWEHREGREGSNYAWRIPESFPEEIVVVQDLDREGSLAAVNVCWASPARGTISCDQLEVWELCLLGEGSGRASPVPLREPGLHRLWAPGEGDKVWTRKCWWGCGVRLSWEASQNSRQCLVQLDACHDGRKRPEWKGTIQGPDCLGVWILLCVILWKFHFSLCLTCHVSK